jgi:Cysteine rich repeat
MKERAMKLAAVSVSLWAGVAFAAGPYSPQPVAAPAPAQPAPKEQPTPQDITLGQYVAEGCAKDIEAYCKNVTPGEGRILACLVAHEDKLSGRCGYVLSDSASMVDQLLTALSYVRSACKADVEKLCADVKPGGGRIAACMKKNEDKLGEGCRQAIADTGLTVTTK